MAESNQLIRKLKNGDRESMNYAFDRYYDKVYGYCYRHVNHRETAQDLTQEVFLRVWKHLEDYSHYGKFENYLYVIAGNLCKDYYKRKKPVAFDELEIQVEENGFVRTEESVMVENAMQMLPELEKEIILLRFYQDLKIKDVAKILNLKLSTTKYHLKQAQKMLEEHLE